jgi:hypothetical protein
VRADFPHTAYQAVFHRETTTIGKLVEGLRESATDDAGLLTDGIGPMEALYRAARHRVCEPETISKN